MQARAAWSFSGLLALLPLPCILKNLHRTEVLGRLRNPMYQKENWPWFVVLAAFYGGRRDVIRSFVSISLDEIKLAKLCLPKSTEC